VTEDNDKKRSLFYGGIMVIAIMIIYTMYLNPGNILEIVIRGSALFGFMSLFLAIVMTEYMTEIKKIVGKPFLKVHHYFAYTGVILILVHPLAFSLKVGSLSPFIPVFTPLETFLELAGRPALYLFMIGALAGIYRARLKVTWKQIHLVNYVAILFALIHGLLIGTDLSFNNPLGILYILMGIVVIYIFFDKRK